MSQPETPPPAPDLNAQVAALLALAVQNQASQAPPEGGLRSAAGTIAAVTALVAAMGSMLGAVQSLKAAAETTEVQRAIVARQERLDRGDSWVGENARIGNLFISHKNLYCSQVPKDDTLLQRRYEQCVFISDADRTRGFLGVADGRRVECLQRMHLCG